MFVSPSKISSSFLNQTNINSSNIKQDFYSSPYSHQSNSKTQVEKKLRVQSINEITRKVENGILSSDINQLQTNQDAKCKSHQNTDSFSSILYHQKQQQQQQSQQQPQQVQSINVNSQSPQQQKSQPQINIHSIPPSLKKNLQKQCFDLINQNSDQFQNQSNTLPQQFVTMHDFRAILEEQLLARDQNIIRQISSCLKDQIIPEIKRQLVTELDQKKSEINENIRNFQSQMQDNPSVQILEDQIYSLKQSFDRSKYLKNLTEMKASTIDQKLYYLEEKISKLEDHAIEQIVVFDHHKTHISHTITDLKNIKRKQNKINNVVNAISKGLVSLEHQVQQNLQQAFALIINRCKPESIEEGSTKIAQQRQNFNNQQELNKQTCQNNKSNNPDQLNIDNLYEKTFQSTVIESFGDYDISPNIQILKQSLSTAFNQPIRIVEMSFNSNLILNNHDQGFQQKDVSFQVNDALNEEKAQQIQLKNTYEIVEQSVQQSVDINYIKKGLPQIFPLVESTVYLLTECEFDQQDQKVQINQSKFDENSIKQGRSLILSEIFLNNQSQIENKVQNIDVCSIKNNCNETIRSTQNGMNQNCSCNKSEKFKAGLILSQQCQIQYKCEDDQFKEEIVKGMQTNNSQNLDDLIQNKIDFHRNYSITDSEY